MYTNLKQFNKGKILVVDDTPDNVRVLSTILAQQGYTVSKALTGPMALTVCQNLLPDLILLDVMMPGMNGYEVCELLKADEKTCQIPVIFISALGDTLDKVKAFEVGGVDYVTKPFQEAEVISRIENHLSLYQLRLELQEKNRSLTEEIEKHQQVQVALEVSEARNQALLNAIPDLLLRLRSDGKLLDYRNAKADEQTYLLTQNVDPESGLIGKNIADLLSSDLAIWVMHYVEQTLLTGQTQVGEYMQQINNTWHAYEVRYVPSGANEVLALIRNISERKQAEAERLKSEALLLKQQQQLKQALKELKVTQLQLIQNEKMTMLGQLAAGIAHEINNPISFIYGNLNYARQYGQDLISLIKTYQEEYPNPSNKVKEIVNKIDLHFLIEDFNKLMDAMYRGSERIRQIVISLRNFSRLDEAQMKPVDLHEGIDNTLLILQNRLNETKTRPAIEVIKQYGELPVITCYASQMNQVFLNLLSNAIDALDSVTDWNQSTPTLLIYTELVASETVRIQIIDNGSGIDKSVRSRLFDPFFTTKFGGTSTGLGLPISYQIVVQQHQGKLMCNSPPDGGTEFSIEIPIRASDS